jgi:hypothetical protein
VVQDGRGKGDGDGVKKGCKGEGIVQKLTEGTRALRSGGLGRRRSKHCGQLAPSLWRRSHSGTGVNKRTMRAAGKLADSSGFGKFVALVSCSITCKFCRCVYHVCFMRSLGPMAALTALASARQSFISATQYFWMRSSRTRVQLSRSGKLGEEVIGR